MRNICEKESNLFLYKRERKNNEMIINIVKLKLNQIYTWLLIKTKGIRKVIYLTPKRKAIEKLKKKIL